MVYRSGSLVQYGNKNVIPIDSGSFEMFISDITKESKIKTISVAVGESPITTKLGNEPKNIRLTGTLNKYTSLKSTKEFNTHTMEGLIALVEEMALIRKDNISSSIPTSEITPIASINNIIIPGMIIKVVDATDYIYQVPLNSEWLVSNSGSSRSYGTNHTYPIFALTLTRWS